MGQYRPQFQVRGPGVNSRQDKYLDIDRQPYRAGLHAAYEAARDPQLDSQTPLFRVGDPLA